MSRATFARKFADGMTGDFPTVMAIRTRGETRLTDSRRREEYCMDTNRLGHSGFVCRR
jgi:hypothetical protein